MSNISISEISQEITSASQLDGNELLLISDVNNSSYTSKKCNLNNIKSYVGTTINNQDKTVIVNGVVTHDDGYTGLGTVTVNVPTGTAKSSSDLTSNGLTVTVPSGLYSTDASKTCSDSNLVEGNIKNGVTIFGTSGTYDNRGAMDLSGNRLSCLNITYNQKYMWIADNSGSEDDMINGMITNCVVKLADFEVRGTGSSGTSWGISRLNFKNCDVYCTSSSDFSNFSVSGSNLIMKTTSLSNLVSLSASLFGIGIFSPNPNLKFYSNGSTWGIA